MPAANLQYSTFKYHEKTLTGYVVKEAELSGAVRVSFNSNFNTITYSVTPDETILKYIVRVTKDNEDYDVDTGNILYYSTNISPNKATNIVLTVDRSTFDKGDGLYRISMYAWNGVMWDHTYLFVCFDGLVFKPADSDVFEVYSDKSEDKLITFTINNTSYTTTSEKTWDAFASETNIVSLEPSPNIGANGKNKSFVLYNSKYITGNSTGTIAENYVAESDLVYDCEV